jgi:hypothetical protein
MVKMGQIDASECGSVFAYVGPMTLRHLAMVSLAASLGCAAAPEAEEFDDAAFLAEEDVCADGKCDANSAWGQLRLADRGPAEYAAAGWTDDMLARFNHQDQGTRTIPISWALALEEAGSKKPFLSAITLERYGLLPDVVSGYNPYGLPVGFSIHQDEDGQDYLGLTCSACHTARIDAGGTTIRIAGGQGLQNISGYGDAMRAALRANMSSMPKAYRMLRRVIKFEGLTNSTQVARDLYGLIKRVSSAPDFDRLYPHKPGVARINALDRGANTAFGPVHEGNAFVSYANVSIPPVWDGPRFDWAQYNASIRQPLARNSAEAIGVGAVVEVQDQEQLFASSLNVEGLIWLEDTVRALESPVWPSSFPAVDESLAAEGATLYDETCAGCHGFRNSRRPNQILPFPSEYGEAGAISNPEFSVHALGTDSHQADGLRDHTILLNDPIYEALGIASGTRVGLPAAFQAATSAALDVAFQRAGVSQSQMGGRPNEWRADFVYRARPLNGVWATAPFLHNGSVRSMEELLGPADQRAERFTLGSTALDTATLGFLESETDANSFDFDVTAPGNDNRGHEFDDRYDSTLPFTAQGGMVGRALSPREIAALIEFMKVIEPLPR